jgi:hypothetical protein
MSALYKLDHTGHGLVAEWEQDDAAAQKVAAGEFDALAAKGFTMFDISDPQVGKPPLKAFDPNATEVIAVPRMAGG